MNYVKGEKFEDLEECLMWCAENKPIFWYDGELDTESDMYIIDQLKRNWAECHKAIKAPGEKE